MRVFTPGLHQVLPVVQSCASGDTSLPVCVGVWLMNDYECVYWLFIDSVFIDTFALFHFSKLFKASNTEASKHQPSESLQSPPSGELRRTLVWI